MDTKSLILGTSQNHEFNTFVRPDFGRIDGFIEDMTGITQADVVTAPSFEEALIASDITPEGRASQLYHG